MISKQWLVLTILTFITILSWVVFDILHTQAEVTIPSELNELIEPLSPEFDTSGLYF